MSRKEIVGEKFTIAFGVDRLNGAFAQLWANPAGDQDGSLINIDSNGVRLDPQADDQLPSDVKRFVANTIKRFEMFRQANPGVRPNIGEQDVIHLANFAGGFPDIGMDVYRIFGDDI